MKITIEITKENAEDLNSAVDSVFKQIGVLAININGALQISEIRNQIMKSFKEPKTKIKVTLYGKVHEYDTMEEAREDMLEAMANTEGSEQDRYTTVYMQLMEGKTEASDDE